MPFTKAEAAAAVKRGLARAGVSVSTASTHSRLRAKARKGGLYPIAIRELEAVWRNTQFPAIPENERRVDLMCDLDGTQPTEAMHLLAWLHESLGVEGAIGEMGCAAGLTSALIGNELLDSDRHFWVFDSFEGLSAPTEKDRLIDDVFELGSMSAYRGTFAFGEDSVLANLAQVGFPAVRTHTVKGFIPDSFSTPGLPDTFAFVYVDLDLYQPIKDALEWLHRDRLAPGGIVMVDDYGWFSEGAQTAVDEFLAEQPDAYDVLMPEAWSGHFIALRRRT